MRGVFVLGLSALALAACQQKQETEAATGSGAPAASNAPAGPVAPPKRKPGLWTQTMASSGMSQTVKICLDAATEAKMTVWGQQVNQDMCAKNSFAPAPGGWTFDSACDLGSMGKVVTRGTVSGDFNSRYVIKATSTTTGSTMAEANRTDTMEITGVWEGACPAGMAPGDMTLPGGMTMNLNNLPGAQKK